MSQQTNTAREETIRKLAYKLWEDDGRPEGRSEEHWLRAAAAFENVAVLEPVRSETAKPAKKARASKR